MSDQRIEPSEIVRCPACHGIFPVLKTSSGSVVVVQPFPVEAVAPHRARIHQSKPISPPVACRKALEGSMSVRKMPPVFVPHIFCCPGGGGIPPMFRSLPDPEEGPQDEENRDESTSDGSGAPEDLQDDQPT